MDVPSLRRTFVCMIVGLLAATGQGVAIASEPAWRTAFTNPVDFDRLDVMRGGFGLPSGLRISFGFERIVYVNGNLVVRTAAHIADIGNMTPDQARALADARSGILVQVGSGNVASSILPSTGLVIQNTLNDQDISAITTLAIGVNSLGHFKALNAQSAMHDALISAPGRP